MDKVITSPTLKCYINGSLLGTVTAIRWNIASGHKGLSGVDQNTVQEWIPTTYGVGCEISVLRVHGDGGLEGNGIVSFSDTVLLEKTCRIDLLNRKTDQIVFSANNAVVVSQNWSAEEKGLVRGTFSVAASSMTNEAKQ